MQVLRIFQSQDLKCRSPRRILLHVLTICLANFYFGYSLVSLSAIDFDIIMDIFNIDIDRSFAQGILQGIGPIGGTFGALATGLLLKFFSRRNSLLFINAMAMIFTIVSVYPNYRVYFLMRFLAGVCSGIFSALVPLITKEYCPLQLTNFMSIFSNLLIVVGLFFLYFFKLILSGVTGNHTGQTYWQIIFLFPIITLTIQSYLLLRVFPYETPHYLAQQNKKVQLKVLLDDIYKTEYVQEMYNEAMLHFQDREDQAQPNDAHSTPRIAFLFAIYFAILGPFLGPNICISYGSEIIGKIVPGLTEVMPALLMFELLIASTISVHFLHIYGRKLHALAGSSACTVCLLIVTTGYFIQTNHLVLTQLLIVFGLLGYLFCFGMTFSPVIWMYIPEVVQPRLVGYAVMGNWLGAALMVILFPMVIEILPNHNSGYVFMAFAIYGMTSLFVINKLMVETKGKKSIDILHEYQELNKQYFGVIQSQTQETELKLLANQRQ